MKRNASEFYDIMLADSDRLLQTVEQVLRAGRASHRRRGQNKAVIDLSEIVRECLDLTRVRHNLAPGALKFDETFRGESRACCR